MVEWAQKKVGSRGAMLVNCCNMLMDLQHSLLRFAVGRHSCVLQISSKVQ